MRSEEKSLFKRELREKWRKGDEAYRVTRCADCVWNMQKHRRKGESTWVGRVKSLSMEKKRKTYRSCQSLHKMHVQL
jgi:hypothetical protein